MDVLNLISTLNDFQRRWCASAGVMSVSLPPPGLSLINLKKRKISNWFLEFSKQLVKYYKQQSFQG